MKYIKLFESMTEIEVAKICKKYDIENWILNPDGTVDIDGSVYLSVQKLTKLPLKFGRVTGDFWCHNNKLTTLENCPKEIGGNFYCHSNQLTSLEGCPTEIGGDFYCWANQLTSLKGAPEYIEGKVDFMPNYNLPEYIKQILELNDDDEDIQKYILKWQKEYDIWRRDGSFNQDRFILMMEDAGDELPKIKLPK
jgi:hypothetical protein